MTPAKSDERAESDPTPLADFVNGAALLLVGMEGVRTNGDTVDPDTPLGRELVGALRDARAAEVPVQAVERLEAAEAVLATRPVSVLALEFGEGRALDSTQSMAFATSLSERHPHQAPVFVILGLAELEGLQPLVQDDRLFYASPARLDPRSTAQALAAAFTHFREQRLLALAAAGRSSDARAVALRSIFGLSESLAPTGDLESVAEPIFEALQELVGIDDLRLWLYDAAAHALRDPAGADVELSAAAGSTSWVARVGRSLSLADQQRDPRYDPDVDGQGRHLLAVPVAGAEGRVLGVIAVSRREGDAFSASDSQLVERLASHLSPVFAAAAPLPLETARAALSGNDDLFRREAIDAHARGFNERGQVLRYDQGWTRWTWILLVTGFVSALVFMSLGRMHDYAAGPAVVRIGQRVDVPSPTNGAVTSIDVAALERVEAGQPLVRLYGASEAAQIANLEEEFEQRLRQRLADPGDSAIEASLIDARTRLEQARDRLDQRIVRAPIAGTVGDVRIRPGQHASAGDLLLSVVADEDERAVLGLVPAQFGPQLEAGQRVRLTLDGYPDLAFRVRLRSVGEEAVGAAEVRQAVGRSMADTLPTAGPVILVDAQLPEASFREGGRTWTFTDGMRGSIEIRVRSRPVLFHLVPGLEGAFRGWDDAEQAEPESAGEPSP